MHAASGVVVVAYDLTDVPRGVNETGVPNVVYALGLGQHGAGIVIALEGLGGI